MKEIFDTYIDNAFDGYMPATFKHLQFAKNYRQFFPKDRSVNLLDIGIGRGEMLTCMREWGYGNSLGVDISKSTVTYCQSLGLRCELTQDTTEWLKAHKSSFALITLLDVLEHVPKSATIPFLTALRGSLGVGGRLIIQVPNLQAPDGQLHRYNDFTHEVGYVEHSLRQVLLSAGFERVTFFPFEDNVGSKPTEPLRVFLRSFYQRYVRFLRRLNGNLNPEILSPVFFAIVEQQNA